MVATMASYLDQLEVSARPSTVAAAELTLRYKVVVATGERDIEAWARERD